MKFFDVIKARRSVRKFRDTPIPEDVLYEMLEAARLAPSGGNAQDYCFGVITDTTIKENIAKAAGNQMWIASAPVVFACCADIRWDLKNQPDDDFGLMVNKLRFGDDLIEYMSNYHNRKACMTLFGNAAPLIPAEHIFLTAVSHGLHACFVGYLDVEEANNILHLPQNLTCLFLLPVGYADEFPCEKSTKNLGDIIFYNQWEL